MPQLKVDSITNRSNNASPELPQGATIPSGKTISGAGGMTVSGTLTGTFSGNGSAIINAATTQRLYALKLVFDPGNQVPYRS
jgi:hypothetical protein